MSRPPLYRVALGDQFDKLPRAVRQMHESAMPRRARGVARVFRTRNPIGSLLARLMSLPSASEKVSVIVDFVPISSGEIWTRRFGEESFRSWVSAKDGQLEERFGPIRFGFDLVPTDVGIEWKFCCMRMLGLRWPLLLSPRIQAAETEVESRYRFAVAVSFPLIGTVVGYEGVLDLDEGLDADAYPVIVFDGICVLCSGSVRFLLARDRAHIFRFASVQSQSGADLLRRHGESPLDPQTMLLIEQGKCYRQTDAVRRILSKLAWQWRLAGFLFGLCPRGLRDWIYRALARRRYRLFGRREQCFVPDPKILWRFLP